MVFEIKKRIGEVEFTFKDEAATPAEFFQKVSFYTDLPSTGPRGETDLKVRYRKTKDGYEYYSLVSESAKKEFRLGQSKTRDGELFPKGWSELYASNSEHGDDEGESRGTDTVEYQSTAELVAPSQKSSKVSPKSATTSSQASSVLAKYGIGN